MNVGSTISGVLGLSVVQGIYCCSNEWERWSRLVVALVVMLIVSTTTGHLPQEETGELLQAGFLIFRQWVRSLQWL